MADTDLATTDTDTAADIAQARAALAQGWIARKSEAFHHLPPPPLAQWLPEAADDAAAEPAWTLQIEGEASAVQARWLNALDPDERRILFADLPLPRGLSAAQASRPDEAAPFTWAQRALCRQGLRITVAASAQPITLRLHLPGSTSAQAPLLVLDLAPGAKVRLLETHAPATGAQNLHQHIRLGAGAQLQHLRLCAPGPDSSAIAHHLHSQLGAQASYRQALVATSSSYHLQRQHIALHGAGASAHSAALLLAGGAQIDQQTHTDIAARDVQSTVETLVLAQGKAHCVANAFTRIAPGSDEADVRQRLSGVPLAGNPRLILRPHLEILHDQVQAAHGATWGAMPQDALFYARQRGLDEATARALIIDGMARALLQRCLGDDEGDADGNGNGNGNGSLLEQWLQGGWLDAQVAAQLGMDAGVLHG